MYITSCNSNPLLIILGGNLHEHLLLVELYGGNHLTPQQHCLQPLHANLALERNPWLHSCARPNQQPGRPLVLDEGVLEAFTPRPEPEPRSGGWGSIRY